MSQGRAFLKGGCGCLAVFAAIGVLVLLIGGSVRADVFGLIILFVIGGVIGLIVNWIYQRGRRDAGRGDPPDGSS